MLDIPCYFLDEFVQRLEFVGIGCVVGYCEVVPLVEERPEFLEEAEHAVDSLGVPRLALLERSKEHFVEAKGVGAVFFNNIIGIYHIIHRFTHLLHCATADVFAIFENKFGIGKHLRHIFVGDHAFCHKTRIVNR